MGRNLLSAVLLLMIVATAVADLGFMHASNDAWPPHARLHAIWNVFHVAATHGLALGLLWIGGDGSFILRVRVAVLLLLAFDVSFFVAGLFAPLFGASVHPDLPVEQMPPTLYGMDGNTLGFLIVLPVIGFAWWSCEQSAGK